MNVFFIMKGGEPRPASRHVQGALTFKGSYLLRMCRLVIPDQSIEVGSDKSTSDSSI